MVMHARKTQRANDGYFEKHQSHPYQNSKYSSSKSFGSSAERYERIRDSPNGNYRSDSPDSQSPRDRDRSYQSKSSYLQKIREKERENRDYKLSRDKYSDCRSPKDKRSRESEHRTNHDRSDDKGVSHSSIKSQSLSSRDRKPVHNNCVEKRDERERVPRVGDWSEHISSSGKKYYYNCKTEVSQWEKPREWIDRERERERDRERDRERERERDRDRDRERFRARDRDRDFDRSYGSSSRSGTRHEKHSNSRGSNGNSTSSVSGSGGATRHWGAGRDDNNSGGSSSVEQSSRDARTTSRKYSDDAVQSTQDMDISPGDSTPTSEMSYGHHHQGVAVANVADQQQQQQPVVATSSAPPLVGPVLLSAALPRLVSHPPVIVHHHHHLPTTPTSRPEASPLYNPQTTSSMIIPPPAVSVPPPQSVATSNTPGPPVVVSLPRMMSQQLVSVPATATATMVSASPADDVKGLQIGHNSAVAAVARQMSCSDASAQSHGLQPLTIDVNHGTGATVSGPIGEGPPTPTHSETLDCGKATVVTTSLSSPPGSSLPSLQSVSSSLQALRPQGPTLTPSLANYYRDDLVNHVRGWPAEILEKQADKLAQEAFIMSSIQCAKVSAELKSARSIVRLTEIQATLQEQRILFLRQQIKTLEEMKSQNSFMSDDS